ncbi:histidine phosphatase family protein [Arcicella sp. LKC2W]|uniref:histidine phosphatase family protein n=1 Tax=Arcicella sp. LKC2W TaxID=2984198 RepID=UPI002B1EBC58|nr:histidine phosphatase family protein [Arcicella sp. LKC2W]MEA5457527.1 histidine phosphatase family protein [Arcicella sp. LKC2W]
MKKISIIFIFFYLTIFRLSAQNTTIYLVRHAEKVTVNPKDKDPLLTEQGQQRALDLAQKLKKQKINNIFSTNYQRTKLTAKPLAEAKKNDLKIYEPKDLKVFANQLLTENEGNKILVVGHSNTVLETIEALGGKRPIPEISDQEYDYLFTVKLKNGKAANVKVEHYGAKNSNAEGLEMMKGN